MPIDFNIIIKGKFYFLLMFHLENLLTINILENNKFIEIKRIYRRFYDIISSFVYNDKFFYISLNFKFIRPFHKYCRYKIYSLDLETYNIILEHSFITREFYVADKNYFIRENCPSVLIYLDIKTWKFKNLNLPFEAYIENRFDTLRTTDDYIIINNIRKIYCINKNSLLTKKIDKDIFLYTTFSYKNYIIIYDIYVYIYDIKFDHLYKICKTNKNIVYYYKNKLLYFNYENNVKDINIKTYDLPISNLFEKCIYLVDEDKFPEIAKNRIIEYRKNHLILI